MLYMALDEATYSTVTSATYKHANHAYPQQIKTTDL